VRGNSDRSLLDAALAEANAAELDDQMVLELGCGPARVRLLDHPEYPSCVRYANALCTDGNLATYGAGFRAGSPDSRATASDGRSCFDGATGGSAPSTAPTRTGCR